MKLLSRRARRPFRGPNGKYVGAGSEGASGCAYCNTPDIPVVGGKLATHIVYAKRRGRPGHIRCKGSGEIAPEGRAS